MRDKIVDFYKDDTKELYESMGIPYKYNIMLHGYPGTGKTSLIFAIASDLGMNVALLQFNRTMTDSDFMRALRRTPEKEKIRPRLFRTLPAQRQRENYKTFKIICVGAELLKAQCKRKQENGNKMAWVQENSFNVL